MPFFETAWRIQLLTTTSASIHLACMHLQRCRGTKTGRTVSSLSAPAQRIPSHISDMTRAASLARQALRSLATETMAEGYMKRESRRSSDKSEKAHQGVGRVVLSRGLQQWLKTGAAGFRFLSEQRKWSRERFDSFG
jgi:hypothetical protein